ncbi:uncharacterized protein B0H18DRAFT_1034328 [Fomitopsis serialis]|uniref:uncharacterized protein n=1 Tax=Fomitopsis serialis TaxID=139415 RepID=UPI0020084EE1|nr:uncharacterized protein B0H18DRAFT_1034328 [Neoantrodia serialis]KAH9917484.1 hypothetical protein B0H18DRAFT_1034328 [Neoantrodia serialis]
MSKSLLTIAVSPLFARFVAVLYRSGGPAVALPLKRKREENEAQSSRPPLPPRIVVCPLREDGVTTGARRVTTEHPSSAAAQLVGDVDTMAQAGHTEAAKAAEVKVRDFAYEPSLLPRVPDAWRKPLHTLVVHDRYLRSGPKEKGMFKLPGKLLWRLMDCGLVTPEEALRNWPQEDKDACLEYASRPSGPYPYIMPPIRKPTAEYRRRVCYAMFRPNTDDISEELVYMPPNTDDMDDGTSEVPSGVLTMRDLSPKFVAEVFENACATTEIIESPTGRRRTVEPETKNSSGAQTDASRPTSSPRCYPLPAAHFAGGSQQNPHPSPITPMQAQRPVVVSTAHAPPPTPRPPRRASLARTESIIW